MGIDYQGVPASLRAVTVEPGDPSYRAVASTYLRGGAPGLVLRPRSPAEVSDALAFARRHPDLPLGIRSAAFQLTAMGADNHRLDQLWEPLRRHFDGLYLSFETDRRPERLADAFPPPVLARLRALKHRYDPGSLFRDNFHLVPDSHPDPTLVTQEAAA